MTEEDLTLEVPRWVYPLGIGTQLLTALAAGYVYLGAFVTAPPLVAGAIALFAWLATTYTDPRRRRVLPLYLGMVVVLLLQGLEQWQFGFASTLHGFPTFADGAIAYTEKIHLTVFTVVAVSVYLLGALGVFFHHPLGNYAAWFVMAYAIVAGISLLFMGLAGGRFHYIPGMVTACFGVPLGVLGGIRLARPR